ncbi:hypothetical protein D9M68_605720 [compost metagenome]
MGAADQAAGLLHIGAGLFRGEGVAHGLAAQLVEVRFEHVLRGDDQRQALNGVLRQLVEQRVDRLALARFAGDMTGARWVAQAVDGNGAVRQAVEVPQAWLDRRARLAEEQALAEIRAAGQFDRARLLFVRVAGQGIEAFAVCGGIAELGRMRVEPAQQPGMDVCRAKPAGAHTGMSQAADQALAHPVECLLWRLPAALRCRADPAVDDQARASGLPAPGQAGDGVVLEQPARLGDGLQVMAEETQVELGEGAALGAGLDVGAQRVQVAVPARVVLGVELHDPGVVLQFVEGVLQHVFQGVADLQQPGGFAPLGADRQQFVEGGDRGAVIQQHALRLRQVLGPRQQVGERGRSGVERLLVGLGGWPTPTARGTGLGKAVGVQPGDVARPSVSRRRGFLGPGVAHAPRPGHQ